MAENYVLLETINLTQSAASVTFDNIPQSGYTDLLVVASTRDDSESYVQVQFNGDTNSANYSGRFVRGNGTNVSSGTAAPPFAGVSPSTSYTANTFGSLSLYIPNYLGSQAKSLSADGVSENNATTAYSVLSAGLWTGTAAINAVRLFPQSGNFVVNSTFSLYGVAATGTTPVTAPKATGGNIVGNDGTYWYHAFLTSGTFTPQTSLSCDALVVAGGGGAGFGPYSGGGGAGGYRTASTQSLTVTNYAVTVGAGGTGGTSGRGTNGVDSSIVGVGISTTSTGGGAGGSYSILAQNNGNSGGSGGGGSSNTGTGGAGNTPSTSPVQGYAGGAGNGNGGAGGGGSSSVGAGLPSTTTMQAAGGSGTANSISGTSVTYAAGGKGSGDGGQAAVNGTTNTGNGGNASGITSPSFLAGGSGGSGIVIIRYAM